MKMRCNGSERRKYRPIHRKAAKFPELKDRLVARKQYTNKRGDNLPQIPCLAIAMPLHRPRHGGRMVASPTASIAVSVLHHAGRSADMLPRTPTEHTALVHKVLLTAAWAQVGLAAVVVCAGLGLIVILAVRLKRRMAGIEKRDADVWPMSIAYDTPTLPSWLRPESAHQLPRSQCGTAM